MPKLSPWRNLLLVRALVVAVSAGTLTGNSQVEHFFLPEVCHGVSLPPRGHSESDNGSSQNITATSYVPASC